MFWVSFSISVYNASAAAYGGEGSSDAPKAVALERCGYKSTFDITPIRKWSMDHRAEDGGILGAEGWLHNGTLLPAVQKSEAITQS